MMRVEVVYDSDQENGSEDTDNGAMALADIEYTDSFEKDFYSKRDHHFLRISVKRRMTTHHHIHLETRTSTGRYWHERPSAQQ
jgi:hypothetical protein